MNLPAKEKTKYFKDGDLNICKGVFPYNFFSVSDDLNDEEEARIKELLCCESLPPKEVYFNTLTQESLSEEKYLISQNKWALSKRYTDGTARHTMRDFLRYYLKVDVKLLAEILDGFRNTSLKEYEIDPSYCYIAPSLAWKIFSKTAVLKHYKEDTYKILLLCQRGIRGGVATLTGERKVEIKNRHVDKEYFDHYSVLPNVDNDRFKENYLMYLDANGLYFWCMTQELPTGEFERCSDEGGGDAFSGLLYARTLPNVYRDEILVKKNPGFIYEVDLEYPDCIKEETKYFPFIPEKEAPAELDFSEYQNRVQPPNYKPLPKLLLTQRDKDEYVVNG